MDISTPRSSPVSIRVNTGPANGALTTLLRQLPKRARGKPLLEGAKVIARNAKRTTLFEDRTGNLRRNIRAVAERNFVVARANAPHAHLVEYGHGGPHPARAHAFMARATAQTKEAVFAVVSREIERELNRLKL